MQIASNREHSVQLIDQPPNSPEFNILDFGLINSIQSIQYKKVTRSVYELLSMVQNAFEANRLEKVSEVFLDSSVYFWEHHGKFWWKQLQNPASFKILTERTRENAI